MAPPFCNATALAVMVSEASTDGSGLPRYVLAALELLVIVKGLGVVGFNIEVLFALSFGI